MDVSNSTGSNTDYRVVAGGGAAPVPPKGKDWKELESIENGELEVLRKGTLEPNTYVSIRIPGNPRCFVQFFKNGEAVSTFSVPPESLEKGAHSGEFLVVLTENESNGKSGKKAHAIHCCRRKAAK